MEKRDSSPQTTLAILLGASQWPEFSDFHGSQAFAQVAAAFSRYLLDQEQFGLPSENFLNLFDTDLSPDKIDAEVRRFLDCRTTELKQAGHGSTDLLFYFVGHGGFVGKNSEYYLAVRCTSSANRAVSGIRMEPLATTITERARYLRRLIILDCCYSAAAFIFFQAEGPAQVAIRQTVDAFKEKAKTVGKGTTLLCSSGKKVPSLLTPSEDSTMFSRALLHVLSTSGNPKRPDEAYLSLREVADLTEEVLKDEQAPRPELHSPDQVDGNVADVPFFPNPIVKAVPASPGIIVLPREEKMLANVPAPPLVLTPLQVSVPVVPRRTVIVGLAGLAVVSAAGGSLLWLTRPQHHTIPTSFTSPTTPPTSTSTPTPTSLSVGTPLYIYRGHSMGVNAAVWSHDGKRVASGSDDTTVQIWNAEDGSHVYTYRGHTMGVNAVAFSPDGKLIASASDDHTAQVWDATTGKTLLAYQRHTNNVRDVTWSPNGQRIASASYDHTVQVWDAITGQLFLTYKGHTDSVFGVAWSPNGRFIASSSRDFTAQVWDASTGNNLFTYTGHTDTVKHVAWSPNGQRIASASYDGTVQVWDAIDGGNETTYSKHAKAVFNVAWSPNGQYIASASADDTAQIWNVATGDTLRIYTGSNYQVNDASWSPDGKFLVTASDDTRVRIWPAP